VSDSGGIPSNAPDKHVTNGVVGSKLGNLVLVGFLALEQSLGSALGNLKDHLSARRCFPAWLARHKDN
jgi:hypothetical protein